MDEQGGKWKSEGSRWWALGIALTLDTSLPFRRCPTRTPTPVRAARTSGSSHDSTKSITILCTYRWRVTWKQDKESSRKWLLQAQ
jgi:hypothetical protein